MHHLKMEIGTKVIVLREDHKDKEGIFIGMDQLMGEDACVNLPCGSTIQLKPGEYKLAK
jgi:hypothetical protein